MISENQLSVYRAIAALCDEVPRDLRAPVEPAPPDHLEEMEIPTRLSAEEMHCKGHLVQEYKRKIEH